MAVSIGGWRAGAMGRVCYSAVSAVPAPRPVHPPRNFEVSRTVTRLEWQPCPGTAIYQVEVALDRPDFSDAETRMVSNRSYFNLHNLRPGHRYYWRVRSDDRTSPVQTFRVAANALRFF